MANDIVAGLFGLTPNQIQQQQQAQINQQASAYAQQAPFERAAAGMYKGGAGLGQIGAGMMGMVNPEVEAAKQREAALSQIDFNTPEGILAAAKAAGDRGDTRMSLQLQMLAQQKNAEEVDLAYKAAKTRKEDVMAEEEPIRRHEEKMAAIEQRAEAAKLRSEDARLSAQQRAEAAREANEMRAEAARERNAIARMLAEQKIGEKKFDVKDPKNWKIVKEEKADRESVLIKRAMTNKTTEKIDNLVKDKDAISSLFGVGYTGYATALTNPAAKRKLESIKDSMKQAGLAMTRGASGQSIGMITEREWPILEGMIARIDSSLGEKEAKDLFAEIKTQLQSMQKIYTSNYHDSWKEYPEIYKPDVVGLEKEDSKPPQDKDMNAAPTKIGSDADYDALPSGAEFIAPDGSRRRKP